MDKHKHNKSRSAKRIVKHIEGHWKGRAQPGGRKRQTASSDGLEISFYSNTSSPILSELLL